MSEVVLESMKHHNTEMNELKTLPEVTMWSFICFWDILFVGYHLAVEHAYIRIKHLLDTSLFL